MSDYPDTFNHMLAAWNEPDPKKVRGHLDKCLAENVRFVDPTIDVTGIDGFEANVHEINGKMPGAIYSRTSNVDSHHTFHRYHWAIHQEGKLLIKGFDMVETTEDGKILSVIGFFGPLTGEAI